MVDVPYSPIVFTYKYQLTCDGDVVTLSQPTSLIHDPSWNQSDHHWCLVWLGCHILLSSANTPNPRF